MNSAIKNTKIKCDNECCDYVVENVKPEDLKKWLGKECPKCGKVLITQQDLNMLNAISSIIDFTNEFLPAKEGEELINLTIECSSKKD